MLPFVAHNILTKSKSPHGYALLCCISQYLVVDSYLTRDVHTEESIAEGRKELEKFSVMMEVCACSRH